MAAVSDSTLYLLPLRKPRINDDARADAARIADLEERIAFIEAVVESSYQTMARAYESRDTRDPDAPHPTGEKEG